MLSPRATSSSPESAGTERAALLDFASLYEAWFDHVVRWLRVLRAPDADIEDIAQDVFLVVRRRLVDFDGRNVAGWLHRIASRQVAQHRRRHWFKHVFSAQQSPNLETLPSHARLADVSLELQDKQLLLEHLLNRMSEKRRLVFTLFEIEGYSGEEIADILDVPINSVWTRLFHARKDFFAFLAQRQRSRREALP